MKTNQNLEELVKHGDQLLPIEVYLHHYEEGKRDLYLHWHSAMEFLFIKEGRGSFTINFRNYEIEAGDLLIIKKDDLHSGVGAIDGGCDTIAIVFDERMLRSFSVDSTELQYIGPLLRGEVEFTTHLKNQTQITRIIEALSTAFTDRNPGFELEIKAHLFYLFSILFREHQAITQTASEKRLQKIKTVVQFIYENMSRHISVGELAETIGYSEYHFLRFFKQETGMTCTEFMNEIRINKATDLLLQSEATVLEIALESGYENVSYFIKKFKEKHGVTPAKFRKR